MPGPEGIAGTMEFNPQQSFDNAENALVYHYDHLGSIERITPHGSTSTNTVLDGQGKPSRYSYDAWGQRRNADTWSGAPPTTADGGSDDATPRGYTGHEMLDDLGLVHMNGRIYDPLLSRFLSADILVQDQSNLQSFNRYSYCGNNPLTFIDPSGFTTISEYEEKIQKEREAMAKSREAAKGSWLGTLKFSLNPSNWARGARIVSYKDAISSIHATADGLSKITDMKIDARKLDDVDPTYKQAAALTAGMAVVPGFSAGNEASKGNYGQAAIEYAKDVAITLILGKVLGPARGVATAEEQAAARVAAAAAEGITELQARQAIARQAYRAAGYSEADLASHMAGIDFTKPVSTTVIPKGTRVAQWQPHNGQGSYYTSLDAPVNTLGINPEGRSQFVYTTTRDVTVLRSTAADTTKVTVPELPARAKGPGGSEQFFSNEKSAFQRE